MPSHAFFDVELVSMYRRAFPPQLTWTLGTMPSKEGVLAGVLQGRPIEPKHEWPLHLETGHIMSSIALQTLSHRTYTQMGYNGSFTDRMMDLASAADLHAGYYVFQPVSTSRRSPCLLVLASASLVNSHVSGSGNAAAVW